MSPNCRRSHLPAATFHFNPLFNTINGGGPALPSQVFLTSYWFQLHSFVVVSFRIIIYRFGFSTEIQVSIVLRSNYFQFHLNLSTVQSVSRFVYKTLRIDNALHPNRFYAFYDYPNNFRLRAESCIDINWLQCVLILCLPILYSGFSIRCAGIWGDGRAGAT